MSARIARQDDERHHRSWCELVVERGGWSWDEAGRRLTEQVARALLAQT